MKVDVAKFMEQQEPASRPSKYRPFDSEIGQLIAAGYTQEQVVEFLMLNGVKSSKAGVSSYIARRKNEDPSYGTE